MRFKKFTERLAEVDVNVTRNIEYVEAHLRDEDDSVCAGRRGEK